MARVRLGRGLFLGLPERLQNRRSNELRPTARAGGSNPLQAARQFVVYLYQECLHKLEYILDPVDCPLLGSATPDPVERRSFLSFIVLEVAREGAPLRSDANQANVAAIRKPCVDLELATEGSNETP